MPDATVLDAICRAEVTKFVTSFHPAHLRVLYGNRTGVDHDVIVATSSETDGFAIKAEPVRLCVFFRDGDEDSGHGY
jgi:hypothetical protein